MWGTKSKCFVKSTEWSRFWFLVLSSITEPPLVSATWTVPVPAHCEHLKSAGWPLCRALNRSSNHTSDYPPRQPPDTPRPRFKLASNRPPDRFRDCSSKSYSQTPSPSQNVAAILAQSRVEFKAVRPKVEFEFGHNVARLLARKRPEPPALETPPCKESLHIWTNQAKNMGRFLDIGMATLWPNSNSTFCRTAFNSSRIWPRIAAIF